MEKSWVLNTNNAGDEKRGSRGEKGQRRRNQQMVNLQEKILLTWERKGIFDLGHPRG